MFTPATSLDYLDYVLDKVDMVLLMSVNPGFGGQKFIPAMMDKARAARAKLDKYKEQSGRHIALEIDGGVKVDNIGELAAAGVDTFVAGSAIFLVTPITRPSSPRCTSRLNCTPKRNNHEHQSLRI